MHKIRVCAQQIITHTHTQASSQQQHGNQQGTACQQSMEGELGSQEIAELKAVEEWERMQHAQQQQPPQQPLSFAHFPQCHQPPQLDPQQQQDSHCGGQQLNLQHQQQQNSRQPSSFMRASGRGLLEISVAASLKYQKAFSEQEQQEPQQHELQLQQPQLQQQQEQQPQQQCGARVPLMLVKHMPNQAGKSNFKPQVAELRVH